MSAETSHFLCAFSVLEPQTNEMLDECEKSEYLKTLSNHYGIDEAALKREYSWRSTKLRGSYRNISFKAFSKMIISRFFEEYPLD